MLRPSYSGALHRHRRLRCRRPSTHTRLSRHHRLRRRRRRHRTARRRRSRRMRIVHGHARRHPLALARGAPSTRQRPFQTDNRSRRSPSGAARTSSARGSTPSSAAPTTQRARHARLARRSSAHRRRHRRRIHHHHQTRRRHRRGRPTHRWPSTRAWEGPYSSAPSRLQHPAAAAPASRRRWSGGEALDRRLPRRRPTSLPS